MTPKFPSFIYLTWNWTLFDFFDEHLGPPGCLESKSYITANLMIHGSPQVLLYTQSPNSQLLFREPGNAPLFGASGLSCIKKLNKAEFSYILNFDFLYKIPQFWFLIFILLGPLGTPGALRVHWIKTLHKTKSDRRLILVGSLFEMLKFQNFGPPPGKPPFRPYFFQPWAKNQNSATNIFFASLSQFWKGVTQPPCPINLQRR